MRNIYFTILLILINTSLSYSQIPIEKYKAEIEALKTESEIDAYWKKLYDIDQNILLNSRSTKEFDSTSIDQMIKTTILFETYETSAYKQDNQLPILNVGHNWNGEAILAFWPIILKCKEVGGIIEIFGGTYPAYELEGISLSFYRYSLFNQESKYPSLLSKIKIDSSSNASLNLMKVFENQKRLQQLKPTKIIGKWFGQEIKNTNEDWSFEFVEMSDGNLYVKTKERIQKLNLVETKSESKIYRIENEPFGWHYELKNNGFLILIDENNEVLINYSKAG
ncbi:MAG: hypothetical protein KDD18_07650 [Mangrovimonas sp.]|nr:hypothetical protein [Mangrovimonas sp.]MCB0432875.1 hypothetical protein [Mangrovimonas sp.]MCB0435776.1 hypothetical protein [Mangrovimonas sp.]